MMPLSREMLGALGKAAQEFEHAAVTRTHPHDDGFVYVRIQRVTCVLIDRTLRERIDLENDWDVQPTP